MTAQTEDLIKRLEGGPHEWGYRDPVEGGFIEDNTPFEAAQALRSLQAEVERLEKVVERSMPFVAIHATSWARSAGLPEGVLNARHYDLLAETGARMDDFTRSALNTGNGEG